MTIALVGSPTTGQKSSSGNLTVNLPSGMSQDDYVICSAFSYSTLFSAPAMVSSGWTLQPTSAGNLKVWYKKMGATPDSTVVITPGSYSGFLHTVSVVCFAYSGVDTTTPLDATPTASSGTSTGPDCPAITTVTNGSQILAIGGHNASAASSVAPSGYGNKTAISAGSYGSVVVSDKSQASSGAENPAAYTGYSSNSYNAVTLALRDADPPVGDTLYPSLFDDSTDTFYSATVTPADWPLTPSLLDDSSDSFYSASIEVTVNYIPSADTAIGNWVDEGDGTTNIYLSIDEDTPNDSDYIRCEGYPSSSTYKCKIDADYEADTYFKVAYRYKKNSDANKTMSLIVRLLEGATQRASWTDSDVSTTLTTVTQTLSGAEFTSITDWSNLYLEFETSYS